MTTLTLTRPPSPATDPADLPRHSGHVVDCPTCGGRLGILDVSLTRASGVPFREMRRAARCDHCNAWLLWSQPSRHSL